MSTVGPVSDRQLDAFDNPAKAVCREGNLRVLREAGFRLSFRRGTIHSFNKAQAVLRQRWRIKVTAITVELDDNMAEVLRRLAANQKRSETEIVREALS